MEARFYLDPETNQPHIFRHGVTQAEAEQVLRGPGEDVPTSNKARMKIGRTSAGRYLRVIYVPDENPNSVFVVTAYELRGKARNAHRRRQRRRHR
ncbi:hypothetical protein RAS1_24440 [Phycisphaerae bacterium RAS1]|nr:hypothetical protein RAS1_24440 [Phycisphaerae bacterium RAS1]